MSERTIFKALSAIQKELASKGISKNQENTYDNYKFRGIDQVLNTVSPIFASHGVVLLPSQESCEIRTIQSSQGKPMNHCKVVMEFTFYDENGDSVTSKFPGEAMDRGDKAVNKACTAAYKYFLFEALCIPVEGTPDADSESHEVGEENPLAAHDAAVKANFESINCIKQSIEQEEWEVVAEAWAEISDDDKRALWVAPTKGGIFTTAERKALKSDEFNAARKVMQEAA